MYISSWDVFTLRLETIFVSYIVDGVSDVGLRVYPGEATTDSQGFVLSSLINQLGTFLVRLTIGKFVAVIISTQTNIIRGCLLHEQYVFLLTLRSSVGDGNDEGESNKLQEEKVN